MGLTEREQQVATLIASGVSRRDLAGRLNLSYSTVDKYLRLLKDKFGAGSFSDLVVRAIAWRDLDGASRLRANGPLTLHAEGNAAPGNGPDLAEARSFEQLFAMLHEMLAPFGVTHVVHSHLKRHEDGSIEHLASRWSLPSEVRFDMSIPASENPSFKLAFEGEITLPIDLEAMTRSEIYAFVPQRIKDQNARFLGAGLARGVTFFVPGLGLSDRLVTSVLFQHLPSARFGALLEQATRLLAIVLRFRNAHLRLVEPGPTLPPKTEQFLLRLAAGDEPEAACAALGISRRAADRHLATARAVYGAEGNLAALARFLADRSFPRLPF